MSDIAIAGSSDSKRGCRVAAESRQSSTIIFEIASEGEFLRNKKKIHPSLGRVDLKWSYYMHLAV
jgi:hypothetical protein